LRFPRNWRVNGAGSLKRRGRLLAMTSLTLVLMSTVTQVSAASAASGTSTVTDVAISSPLGIGNPVVAIGRDGLGLLAYFDSTAASLNVAHCRDVNCTSAQTTTVEPRGSFGAPGAIRISTQIGSDGLGLILFFHATPNGWDLKLAHCANIACTSSTATVIRTLTRADGFNTLLAGTDGLPMVFYEEPSQANPNAMVLRAFHCGNLTCTANGSDIILETDAATAGITTTVAVGPGGFPIVAYYSLTGLRILRCVTVQCTFGTTSTPITAAQQGVDPSLVIGGDGLPLVSYLDSGTLKVTHCADLGCDSRTVQTLDSNGFTGVDPSLARGSDGLGITTYWDNTHKILRSAHCDDTACSHATIATVIGSGNAGGVSSVAIGTDGLPLIGGMNATTKALEVAHCGRVDCVGLPTGGNGGGSGVRSLTIFNCKGSPSTRLPALTIWSRDVTVGGPFTGDTNLSNQWGTFNCPAVGQPFVFNPGVNGHAYEVVAVDFTLPGCTDDPTISSCRAADIGIIANTAGPDASTTVG
jgi:hypothetical protein